MAITVSNAKSKAQEWLGEDLKIIATYEYDKYYGFESVPKDWNGKGEVSGTETFVNKETGKIENMTMREYCKIMDRGKKIQ